MFILVNWQSKKDVRSSVLYKDEFSQHADNVPLHLKAAAGHSACSHFLFSVSVKRLPESKQDEGCMHQRASHIPFLGRPRPLPVLDLRSLVLTLPFGLCGSPPAKSPDSEKDSLVELRDEDLRRRRLALALRRASCSAFS